MRPRKLAPAIKSAVTRSQYPTYVEAFSGIEKPFGGRGAFLSELKKRGQAHAILLPAPRPPDHSRLRWQPQAEIESGYTAALSSTFVGLCVCDK
jgi:hypothetical protein